MARVDDELILLVLRWWWGVGGARGGVGLGFGGWGGGGGVMGSVWRMDDDALLHTQAAALQSRPPNPSNLSPP